MRRAPESRRDNLLAIIKVRQHLHELTVVALGENYLDLALDLCLEGKLYARSCPGCGLRTYQLSETVADDLVCNFGGTDNEG